MRSEARVGFTLIEILVAAAAFSLLICAVYAVFSHGVRLRNRAVAGAEYMETRLRAIALIRRDLRSALVSGGLLAYELEGGVEGPVPKFPGRLSFTTASGRLTPDGFGADVQEVAYYIVERDAAAVGEEGGVLVRAVERNLLAPVRETPPEQSLLPGACSLETEFFDGEQWVAGWTTAETPSEVPQAVRVRIEFANGSEPDCPIAPIDITVPWTTYPVFAPENETGEGEGA